MADVAAHAGVSEATVSRVLNAKPGVAAETRQAVLTAMDVLGYERPSRLRSRSAGLVGLIVPELENPIFPALAQVIETILAQNSYTPVLCTQTPGGVPEDEYVEMLLDRDVAGIIFVSGLHADTHASHDRYRSLRQRGLPIVLINGYVPDLDAPFISNDDATSIELAVNHLASLGHVRIGLAVGPERFLPAARKIESFRRTMRALLGDTDPPIAASFYTVEGGGASAAQLLDAGCTAIVCGSDLMALGAIRAVRARGLQVPRDVSVVGYDDSPLIPFTDPPLTTVRQAVLAMGKAAVQALIAEISGTKVPRTEFLFAPELVVRGSTAVVPVRTAAT
jgi:LacI family transcriptional regulator, repressor for deo operon, udp, cdd, tsx, nupC, and nupG